MSDVQTQTKPAANAVVQFSAPRLPYHDAIKERFGIDKGQWKVLVEATFPSAKSVDSIALALSYCKSRGLDIFKRPVAVVPMWSSEKGTYVETIWPTIAETRTTAARTKDYAGCDAVTFGTTVKEKFTGRVKVKGEWKDEAVEVEYPQWAQMTFYRIIANARCAFVGPKVYWKETYATIGASNIPNSMWQDRPFGQLEKCAEAAGLRRAFPEETGNEYTAEEMHGRTIGAETITMHAAAPTPANDGPPNPDEPTSSDEPPTEIEAEPVDEVQWLKDLKGAFSGCEDMTSLGEEQKRLMVPMKGKVSAETWVDAEALVMESFERINSAAA